MGATQEGVIGHTLPRGATIASVSLEGVPISDVVTRDTNQASR
jgi:hypothetical protein